jgi:predicted DNA-binding transcriptional regulator YafY
MKLPDTLTPEQSAAIVACLRILARRGEEILSERAAMQSRDATAPTDERAADSRGKVEE